ncbi:hypothetical protein B9479_007517 [Cryptococcus floricola]|uniref:DNA-binding protein RAP1 n=1 Tax=Cryptococcus floricola TaxID=2591691 RepID=A0A5D3ALS6_9TREE|nr:hypothetical protein B9479_007517 [Cryptococcus floricola]
MSAPPLQQPQNIPPPRNHAHHPAQPERAHSSSQHARRHPPWPVYYPIGGTSYLLEGTGIFVDPRTGVGLSVWIDPSLEDLYGLIKVIWKEGGHISPTPDSPATQLLLVSPHQTPTLERYSHPERLPSLRHHTINIPKEPLPGRELAWQVKVMLDRCWINRCLTAGHFVGYKDDWGGCRIGGPPAHVKMYPLEPMKWLMRFVDGGLARDGTGRAGGEISRDAMRREGDDSDEDILALPGPPRVPASRSSIVGNGRPRVESAVSSSSRPVAQQHNTGTFNRNPNAGPGPGPSRPARAGAPTGSPAPVLPAKPKTIPSPAKYESPSLHPTLQGYTSAKSKPKPPPSQGSSSAVPAQSFYQGSGPQPSNKGKAPARDEDQSAESDSDVGAYESDGDWPTGSQVPKSDFVSRETTTLSELDEIMTIERMCLGPGIRDSYFIGLLRKKYGAYSYSAWREIYLCWLYQNGQFSYLSASCPDSLEYSTSSAQRPIQADEDHDDTPRYIPMEPSTLSWSDVNHVFEKENEIIWNANLNLDETGNYLADKYGVYLGSTWKAYFTRWRKQKQGKLIDEDEEEPAPKAPVKPAVQRPPTVIRPTRGPKRKSPYSPPLPAARRKPSPPSQQRSPGPSRRKSLARPMVDMGEESDSDDGAQNTDSDDEPAVKTSTGQGVTEYMTNERLCKIFEERDAEWEGRGASRSEIAGWLEKEIGVYSVGSWQIYYNNWKTKKGRFAYLAKDTKPKQSPKVVKPRPSLVPPAPPPMRAAPRPAPRKSAPRAPAVSTNPQPSASRPSIGKSPAQPAAKPTGPKKQKKPKVAVVPKKSFTDEEEKAMAQYVVNYNVTTVLPSYLTWQGWAANPRGYPKRTPTSYATHCWKFRDRMEALVAQLKGTPNDTRWHGQLAKGGPGTKGNDRTLTVDPSDRLAMAMALAGVDMDTDEEEEVVVDADEELESE